MHELAKARFQTREDRRDLLLSLAQGKPYKLLVARRADGFLRIKTVTEEVRDELMKDPNLETVETVHGTYLFGFEPTKLHHKDCHGKLVSCWGIDENVTDIRMTYKFARNFIGTYKRGYGDRGIASCLGLNKYFGRRWSWRPHPSPFVDETDIGLCQHYDHNDGWHLLAPYMEKRLKELEWKVLSLARRWNPDPMEFVERVSKKGIFTTGNLPRMKRKTCETVDGNQIMCPFSRFPVYSFANTLHTDREDHSTKKLQAKWLEEAKNAHKEKRASVIKGDNKKWTRIVKMLESGCFSFPTTCGYQFVYDSKETEDDLEVHQFFSMEGLGMAAEVEDGVAHHFMASFFAHSTSVCVCQRKSDGMISSSNCDDNFLVVAWGSSTKNSTADGEDEAASREEDQAVTC